LQVNVMIFGKAAPNLVATLNIAAFNVGNALGAWVGGLVISRNLGLQAVPLAAGGLALGAVAAMRLSQYFSQRLATGRGSVAQIAGAPS
jgi:DHA1 family inner membrane transport protein